jgi:hypothetical protein
MNQYQKGHGIKIAYIKSGYDNVPGNQGESKTNERGNDDDSVKGEYPPEDSEDPEDLEATPRWYRASRPEPNPNYCSPNRSVNTNEPHPELPLPRFCEDAIQRTFPLKDDDGYASLL